MPAKRITDAFVRNVRPPLKTDKPNQVVYIDTLERGLALVLNVSYGGSRSFAVLTYDAAGKPRTRKLGRYPGMGVKQARALARQHFENPAKAEAEAKAGTFRVVAEDWFRRHVEANGLRSAGELRRQLERYIFPRWRDRPFTEIRRSDVNALLDEIADDHGAAQADAVLATIRGVCNWFEARSDYYTSPIARKMRRQTPKARDRVLTDDEIRAVWGAGEGAFGGIVKIALLTAQRRQQIGKMRWEDVDLGTGVWTIPAEAREKGTGGALKLPRAALDVIEAQPRIAENPYVFASGAKKHFNSWSQRKAELDAKLPKGMPHWTIHDLRRTARSLMARADVRPDVAERVMGHVIPGVEGVYDRHQYADHKADALTRLAALIDSIINPRPANVIRLGRKRR